MRFGPGRHQMGCNTYITCVAQFGTAYLFSQHGRLFQHVEAILWFFAKILGCLTARISFKNTSVVVFHSHLLSCYFVMMHLVKRHELTMLHLPIIVNIALIINSVLTTAWPWVWGYHNCVYEYVKKILILNQNIIKYINIKFTDELFEARGRRQVP